MTQEVYLELTYRHGKLLAGYLHLPHKAEQHVARSREVRPGLVMDYDRDDQPVGLEIVSPRVSRREIMEVLREAHCAAVPEEELAPLPAAS